MTGAYLPIRTTAENYGPFPRLDYTYEAGVTAVIGPNGAGKSFLVNACAVALYGHTPRGTTLAEWALRNTDADPTDAVGLYLDALDADDGVKRAMREQHDAYAEEVGA